MSVTCTANAPDPHLLAAGVVKLDGWIAGVTMSVFSQESGPPRLQVSLDVSAGVEPQVMPSDRATEIDELCPRRIMRASGVL